jgi:predicted amidohydrolase
MNVTVCQLRNDPAGRTADWDGLVAHVQAERSDLVLLPEMAFYPWPFWQRSFDAGQWQAAMAAHDQWLERLGELAPAVVLGSRPVEQSGRRLNEGFVWDEGDGYRPAHHKYYLPDDPGFWEASWYGRGEADFTPIRCRGAAVGFLICTELWFMQRARTYGQAGIHLLVCPRATELRTVDKWLAGGRSAAVIAGAFCLSSNPYTSSDTPVSLGGQGWIIDPDGDVLALTTVERPFATLDIDLAQAEAAKTTYPRYVLD